MSWPPSAGDGFWADLKVKKEHLRLFSEVYELGSVAVVFDMNSKCEIGRKDADDLEDGKKRAEELAQAYLRAAGVSEFPTVTWTMNAQARLKRGRG